jgi:hypothetical protein
MPQTLISLFIFERREDISADADEIISALVGRFKTRGLFQEQSFRLVTMTEMSAAR